MSTTIVSLASIPAILALVNLGKALGVKGKWAALLAVLLGVGLAIAQYALGGFGWYQAAVQGIILGLSAAGLYDMKATTGGQGETENVAPDFIPTISDNLAELEMATLERVPKHLAE